MITIINDKKYDTDKMDVIVEYRTKVEHSLLFTKLYPYHYAKLYKSKNGTYLRYIGASADSTVTDENYQSLEIITEREVKKLLIDLGAISTYEKLFGTVEEG